MNSRRRRDAARIRVCVEAVIHPDVPGRCVVLSNATDGGGAQTERLSRARTTTLYCGRVQQEPCPAVFHAVVISIARAK